MMKTIESYYDDLDNAKLAVTLHKVVKEQLTLDDLVSIAVCILIYTDNHPDVQEKLNQIAECGLGG